MTDPGEKSATPPTEQDEELLDESLGESFPASDTPTPHDFDGPKVQLPVSS